MRLTTVAGKAKYPGPITVGNGYEYRQLAPKRWLIWAEDEKAMVFAKKLIGCGLCVEEPWGEVRIIEVISK